MLYWASVSFYFINTAYIEYINSVDIMGFLGVNMRTNY